MKVALVTDWMDTFGGGERVLMEMHRMFPEAPVFTAVYDAAKVPRELRGWDVRPSFIQRLPLVRSRHLAFLPLMPLAFEQFDLRGYDVVVSMSSACAKGVITSPGTLHLNYCHTPCRYIWDLYHEYTDGHPWLARALFAPLAHRLRVWDRVASDRVDHFVANSAEVAGRIRKHYRRTAEVVYPPVDVDRLTPSGEAPGDFYLVVSRLVPYKRVDLAVRAATRLGRRLVVVGRGSELKRLRALAGPTVEFRGHLQDDEVARLYAGCRALLFPGFEDFGITPVEAQAAGRPVIAYAAGGALETVRHGETGVHFAEQTEDALVEAMLELERSEWDPAACRRNAERFSAERFRDQMTHTIRAQRAALLPAPAADPAPPGVRPLRVAGR